MDCEGYDWDEQGLVAIGEQCIIITLIVVDLDDPKRMEMDGKVRGESINRWVAQSWPKI